MVEIKYGVYIHPQARYISIHTSAGGKLKKEKQSDLRPGGATVLVARAEEMRPGVGRGSGGGGSQPQGEVTQVGWGAGGSGGGANRRVGPEGNEPENRVTEPRQVVPSKNG